MIVEAVVALLLLASAVLVLTASVGLWRLDDFYLRMHAPALANTLGSWAVVLASMVFFTSVAGRPVMHQWVIVILLAITVPVGSGIVARAALFHSRRDRL